VFFSPAKQLIDILENFPKESNVKIEINIPDLIAKTLPGDMSRRILESIAIEGYRRGELSPKLVGMLIGIDNRWEVERFLAEKGVELNYNWDDFLEDTETLRQLEQLKIK
jgi:predicted HTH domain antitoxin